MTVVRREPHDQNFKNLYHIDNPVVKILLPKMDCPPEDRIEVIRHAYMGLFRMAVALLFDKYVDFIDAYAGVCPEERETIYCEITEHKETAMLAQYIKDKGREEGWREGRKEIQRENIVEILQIRFGTIPTGIVDRINSIEDPNALKNLLRMPVQLKQIDPDKLFS